MENKKFQRKKEDFICEKCGRKVTGSGYTDHCPKCLWSKHRDVNPGDRQAKCGGLMKPVGVDFKGGEYSIFYCCEKCGHEFRVKAAPDDDFDEILKLSKNEDIKDQS